MILYLKLVYLASPCLVYEREEIEKSFAFLEYLCSRAGDFNYKNQDYILHTVAFQVLFSSFV